jgi:hypothetical protein
VAAVEEVEAYRSAAAVAAGGPAAGRTVPAVPGIRPRGAAAAPPVRCRVYTR